MHAVLHSGLRTRPVDVGIRILIRARTIVRRREPPAESRTSGEPIIVIRRSAPPLVPPTNFAPPDTLSFAVRSRRVRAALPSNLYSERVIEWRGQSNAGLRRNANHDQCCHHKYRYRL